MFYNFFKTSTCNFRNAATDPKYILCCFRAVVLHLLASCVFLVFFLQGLLLFLLGPFFSVRFLAAESGV